LRSLAILKIGVLIDIIFYHVIYYLYYIYKLEIKYIFNYY